MLKPTDKNNCSANGYLLMSKSIPIAYPIVNQIFAALFNPLLLKLGTHDPHPNSYPSSARVNNSAPDGVNIKRDF